MDVRAKGMIHTQPSFSQSCQCLDIGGWGTVLTSWPGLQCLKATDDGQGGGVHNKYLSELP